MVVSRNYLLFTSAIVVDKAPATLGYAKEWSTLLNADHRGVCKFELPTDPNYGTLRDAFVNTIDSILPEALDIVKGSLLIAPCFSNTLVSLKIIGFMN